MAMPGSAPGGEGDFSVYVGDLDPNVTDSILLEAFSSKFKSILSANVIVDSITKRSKKFGFVRFGNGEESQKAITEMNGQYLLSRPMKLNVGFKKSSMQQPGPSFGVQPYNGCGQTPAPTYPPAYQQYNDPYAANKQNYGYSSYQQDPYAASSYQPPYSSYPQYPPPSSGSAPYSSGGGSTYPSAPSGGYDYNQPAPTYPPYSSNNAYSNNQNQGYPQNTSQSYPSSTAPAYPPTTPSQPGYNYPTTGYDYLPQTAPQVKVETTVPTPVQATKEIDYDIVEKEMKPLYDDNTTSSANEEYYHNLMKTKGSVDLLI